MVLFTLKRNDLNHRCLVVAEAENMLSRMLSSDSIQLKRQLEDSTDGMKACLLVWLGHKMFESHCFRLQGENTDIKKKKDGQSNVCFIHFAVMETLKWTSSWLIRYSYWPQAIEPLVMLNPATWTICKFLSPLNLFIFASFCNYCSKLFLYFLRKCFWADCFLLWSSTYLEYYTHRTDNILFINHCFLDNQKCCRNRQWCHRNGDTASGSVVMFVLFSVCAVL